MRPLVVGQPGPVGRADLAEPRAGDLEDLGQPEAAADLDELPARDDHLAAGGQRAQGQDGRRGVVVDDGRRLGAGQPAEQRRRRRRSGSPRSPRSQVELEVAVAPGHLGDRLDRLGRQRGPAEPGVEQDARWR